MCWNRSFYKYMKLFALSLVILAPAVVPNQAGSAGPGTNLQVKAPGEPCSAPVFPIKGTRKDDLGNGRHMETTVTISNTGRVDGQTTTWSTHVLKGFTGGVVVVVMDCHGNITHTTQFRTYGVNAKGAGKPKKRKEFWNETFDTKLLPQAGFYAIYHDQKPQDRWREFMADTKLVAETVKSVAEAVTPAAGAVGVVTGGGG